MSNINLIEKIRNNYKLVDFLNILSFEDFKDLLENYSDDFLGNVRIFKTLKLKHPNLEDFDNYLKYKDGKAIYNLYGKIYNNIQNIYEYYPEFFNKEKTTIKFLIKNIHSNILSKKDIWIDDYFSNEEIIENNMFFPKAKNISDNYFLLLLENDPYLKQGFNYFVENIQNVSKENISKYIKNTFSQHDRSVSLTSFIKKSWYVLNDDLKEDIFNIMLENKDLICFENVKILNEKQKQILKEKYPLELFYMIDSKYFDLSRIPLNEITEEYETIREIVVYILKNDINRLGTQSLKYFLVKNKTKLDKELLYLVLDKHPKMVDSLKIKDVELLDFVKSKINYEQIKIKNLFFKQELSDEEKEIINKNSILLFKIKNFDKINDYSLSVLNDLINKNINNN